MAEYLFPVNNLLITLFCFTLVVLFLLKREQYLTLLVPRAIVLNPNLPALRRPKKPTAALRQNSIVVYPELDKTTSKPKLNSLKPSNAHPNELYFSDCLTVLKRLFAKGAPFIDLIYIDPPFNSKRNYNVLFESIDLKDSIAQKQAFADTWSNYEYVDTLSQLMDLDKDLYTILRTFHDTKCFSDSQVAYLTTMAIRIWYMHKLLKETGSFYLHCDPTMSHYLKLICDMIFGEKNFRNEITWQRTGTHNDSKTFANNSDIILFYTRSNKFTFNTQFQPYDDEYLKRYKFTDKRGKYLDRDLTAGGLSGGGYEYEWKGIKKIWRCPKSTMEQYEADDKIYYTKNHTPRLKQYLHEMPGVACTSIWTDLAPINSQSQERLGYPTQKPVALLERIINASTNEGDVVADFFCGCGTSVAAAQKLNRKWLGVDISHLAVRLISKRLSETYGESILNNIKVDGFPEDIDSAKELAKSRHGRLDFQDWVIEVLLHGVSKTIKTGDGGCDGYLTYYTDKTKEFALIEIKSGNVGVKNIREFIHVVDREKAAAGIFVCFKEQVTREMTKEAKSAGTISIENLKTGVDRIQILTVDDMLYNNAKPNLPNTASTFKQAERIKVAQKANTLFDL